MIDRGWKASALEDYLCVLCAKPPGQWRSNDFSCLLQIECKIHERQQISDKYKKKSADTNTKG